MQPNYQETINQKRQAASQTAREQQDLGSMLAELKKMQLASLMGSQGKSTVILTDQTDLGDKLKAMVDSFTAAVTKLDSSDMDKQELSSLKALQTGLQELKQAVINSKDDNSDIVAAIKALKLDVAAPVVNVPQAKVTVQSSPVDLKPLQATLEQYFTHEAATETDSDAPDLDCYRAQDIIDLDDVQYIGFQNPDGNWYIIENDIKGNKMRYVFGSKNYATAFKKAASYQYQLLDKAINATA